MAVICLSMPLLEIVIVSKPCCNNRMPWKMNSKLLELFLMQLSFAYRLYWLRSVYDIYAISHYSPLNTFPRTRLVETPHVTEYWSLCSIFFNSQKCLSSKNIWRVINTLASLWGWKYARIFDVGHHLFLKADRFPQATLSENLFTSRTNNVRTNIIWIFYRDEWRLLSTYTFQIKLRLNRYQRLSTTAAPPPPPQKKKIRTLVIKVPMSAFLLLLPLLSGQSPLRGHYPFLLRGWTVLPTTP